MGEDAELDGPAFDGLAVAQEEPAVSSRISDLFPGLGIHRNLAGS